MNLFDIVRNAKRQLIIIGVLPIAEELEKSLDKVADMLISEQDLNITIICENDTLCFQYSLLTDTKESKNRKTFANLVTHRNRILGKKKNSGLKHEVERHDKGLTGRITVLQQNAHMPFSVIIVDDVIYYTFITNSFPTIKDYVNIDNDNKQYNQILQYKNFFLDGEGTQFLSLPGNELIQLYDRENYPRGIFPRSCFYTTKFKRHSMWGFIFNRKGELLLHQRSMQTKDGRGLWDKSTGGHIDLREESIISAKRELVEELFMPEAEYSKYMMAYIKDIISFGEWNLEKRPEISYKSAFSTLDDDDWIMFSATNEEGDLLTIDRVSQRRINIDNSTVVFKPTNFVSDVYLFIAPEGYIDDEEQMQKTFEKSEEKGAASAHKLISLTDLRDWIEKEISNNKELDIFTDDMIYINNEYMGMLEMFSEFIRYTFEKE